MSLQYNRIINYSNPKNKKTISIKKMRGMYDPAFQSNNTLKEYINKKLTLYKESDFHTNPKPENLLKYKEKEKSKKVGLNNRNFKNSKNTAFNEYSHYSRTQSYNLSNYNNASMNNLRKNKEQKNNSNRTNNNNYYVFRCSNEPKTKIFDKIKLKKNKNKNDANKERDKMNNYFNIILTPNSNNKECGKTTPINPLNKIKGIYRRKNMILNKSYKSHSRDSTTILKKEKELYSPGNFNSKNKNLLKKDIYNIINHKPLNKTYFKENSKYTNNNSKSYNENIISNNYNDYFQNENSDKYKELLLKDESLNESECPEPMPYVTKYSDLIDKENISNNTLNILNTKNICDLNEPKEEKNIPLPIKQKEHNYKIYENNHKKFIYMKQSKFLKKNL